ncbi:MAG: aminoglycoside N(3)-acetyltransferase [Candidatus Taylorbacteria bacterium]|nr:aminoglycoside N(3)-acetyltransferase [Candidatus Taylorbacteria bacterium]
MTTLYTYNDAEIGSSDFSDALRQLDINRGDTLFVHSDVGVFGKLAAISKEDLLGNIFEVLKTAVGPNGNLIVPTFTYSFCNKETYDIQKSPSTVGVFTEFFRKQKDVTRTSHPIFSTALWGKDALKLSEIDMDSFGSRSIFAKIVENGGKLLFFGAPFHSCTFLHYIEQKHGVPYRYMKTFTGTLIDEGKKRELESTYFVRDLEKAVVLDTTRLEEHLEKRALMNTVKVGSGKIKCIDSGQLLAEGLELLDDDINIFLKR